MSGALLLALLVGGALLLAWVLRPPGLPPPGVRLLMIAYVLLGAWALWFGLFAEADAEPAWFLTWKPTVMYWTLAAVMLVAPALGWGYPARAIVGTYFAFSNREWHWINLALSIFMMLLGGLNLYIAATASLGGWEGFKYSCMVNVAALLLLRVTFLWLDALTRFGLYLYGRARSLFH